MTHNMSLRIDLSIPTHPASALSLHMIIEPCTFRGMEMGSDKASKQPCVKLFQALLCQKQAAISRHSDLYATDMHLAK